MLLKFQNFNFIIGVAVVLCVCDVYMGMHVSQSACGGQITTLWHPFSLSTFTWDPRSEFRSTNLDWAISPAQLGNFLPCYEVIIRSPVCEALAYNSFCQSQNVLSLEFPVNVLMKLSCLQIWKETVSEQAEGSQIICLTDHMSNVLVHVWILFYNLCVNIIQFTLNYDLIVANINCFFKKW